MRGAKNFDVTVCSTELMRLCFVWTLVGGNRTVHHSTGHVFCSGYVQPKHCSWATTHDGTSLELRVREFGQCCLHQPTMETLIT